MASQALKRIKNDLLIPKLQERLGLLILQSIQGKLNTSRRKNMKEQRPNGKI